MLLWKAPSSVMACPILRIFGPPLKWRLWFVQTEPRLRRSLSSRVCRMSDSRRKNFTSLQKSACHMARMSFGFSAQYSIVWSCSSRSPRVNIGNVLYRRCWWSEGVRVAHLFEQSRKSNTLFKNSSQLVRVPRWVCDLLALSHDPSTPP